MKKKPWARRPLRNLKVIFTLCLSATVILFFYCLGTEFTLIKFLLLLTFFISALCYFWAIKVVRK